MKHTFIILSFCAFFALNTAFSQGKLNVDSLTVVLNKYPKEDTVKAKILIALSKALVTVNFKDGIAYIDKALALTEKFNTQGLKADALYIKARHLEIVDKNDEAFDLAEQALKIYEPLNLRNKMAEIHNLFGWIYYNKRNAENAKKHHEIALALCNPAVKNNIKPTIEALSGLGIATTVLIDEKNAIPYFEQAVEFAHKHKERGLEAISLGSLSTAHYHLANYTKAIEYLQKAMFINETIGNNFTLAYNHLILGNIFLQLEEIDNSLDYYKKSLSIAIKTDNKSLEANLYNKIGVCYKEKKMYGEAIINMEKAINLWNTIGKNTIASSSKFDLGGVYNAMGRKVEAHRCFQESLSAAKKIGNEMNIASNLAAIGQFYIEEPDSVLVKIGINPNERYSKALEIATEALNVSVKTGAIDRISNSLKLSSIIHEKNKDYIKAYDTYKQYIAFKDSISGDEVKKQITRKEIQYEYDKKEAVFKVEQQLTAEQLEKQKLLTFQQGQALLLNEQTLSLKNKDLLLANKEKDLVHLAYLKEQAEKQKKTQDLSLSEEREKVKEGDLMLKNLELSAQQKQNLYLGLFSLFLLGGLGTLLYFYNTLKKQKNIIAQQNELNEHTIAILSHDIKEPLLGVKLMLKKINKDDPFVAQASQSLENQINSVNGILNNLLKMKKLSLGKKDKNIKANAKSVVQNVSQELSIAIQSKGLTIQNDLADDLMLPIAPEKLQVIVHNLLSNAVKYSFPNQTVRIFKDGKGLCIQDFGVGLSEEQRTKLMREVTASEKGTNAERGNGLGLFLVGAMLQGEAVKVIFDSPAVGGTIAKVLG